MSFADKAYKYFTHLELRHKLPRGVEVMNPYKDRTVRECFRAFLKLHFDDSRKRVLIFGINPSRFGAGITGVAFTDPVALRDFCGVPNAMGDTRELSSTFVYQVIEAMGGAKKFYKDFFLTATCPLGFTKDGVNYNFYDHPDLQRDVTPFIVRSMKEQIAMGGRSDIAVVLGTGKLMAYLERLNDEHKFFRKLVALEHPRFIMQYRRKKIGAFVAKYKRTLEDAMLY
ncbi:MAG TPA: uracil-DNA glycosylase family protein [Candidatus Eisenbacteria bacterium]|nr:uracil-DNA glycosylase family protein [Candidatus Eisenbacteria bacterium]